MTLQEHAEQDEKQAVPSGEVIAADVPLDEYMARYAQHHCEWIEGMVIKMSPAGFLHNKLIYYLEQLIEAYFEIRPAGVVIGQPFVLRLPEFPNRRREPDLLIVLDDNPHELHQTYMDGPPDICIEVVSPESTERDYGEKFSEYEKGGVPEYWVIDPLREEAHFWRLSDQKLYRRQPVDAEGRYHTPTLPGLAVHVPILWQEKLPGPAATVDAVRRMLAQG